MNRQGIWFKTLATRVFVETGLLQKGRTILSYLKMLEVCEHEILSVEA